MLQLQLMQQAKCVASYSSFSCTAAMMYTRDICNLQYAKLPLKSAHGGPCAQGEALRARSGPHLVGKGAKRDVGVPGKPARLHQRRPHRSLPALPREELQRLPRPRACAALKTTRACKLVHDDVTNAASHQYMTTTPGMPFCVLQCHKQCHKAHRSRGWVSQCRKQCHKAHQRREWR